LRFLFAFVDERLFYFGTFVEKRLSIDMKSSYQIQKHPHKLNYEFLITNYELSEYNIIISCEISIRITFFWLKNARTTPDV